MSDQLAAELHSLLTNYLTKKISLHEFRDRFDTTTWGIVGSGRLLAEQIAGEIELRLAEFTSGHRDESELQVSLQVLTLLIGPLLFKFVQTSSASNLTAPWADFGSNFGKSGAEVSLSGTARRA